MIPEMALSGVPTKFTPRSGPSGRRTSRTSCPDWARTRSCCRRYSRPRAIPTPGRSGRSASPVWYGRAGCRSTRLAVSIRRPRPASGAQARSASRQSRGSPRAEVNRPGFAGRTWPRCRRRLGRRRSRRRPRRCSIQFELLTHGVKGKNVKRTEFLFLRFTYQSFLSSWLIR